MEGEDTGCLSELEKKGLHQVAGILENIMGCPVRLFVVNNIIVVTYCSKCHRLSLSLIAINEIMLMG